MSFRSLAIAIVTGLALGFTGIAVPSATAQQAAPAPKGWGKECNKDPKINKVLCITTFELVSRNGQPLALVAIQEIKGEARGKSLLVVVPTGMLIPPGISIKVDSNRGIKAAYGLCSRDSCLSQRPITEAFINQLKRGAVLNVTTINPRSKAAIFKITLTGFTKAYESDVTPPVNELAKGVQKLADEARQRLLEEQKKKTKTK
ncbi:MAG: invasion-associated locus B family protein [Hyphomicrobiales bacterium]|nr:MAG: invasion-associated locus B family protein [Hyphomicrobiales bacterium]